MKETSANVLRKVGWILIPLILMAVSFYGGTRYGYRKAIEGMESKTDTVTKVVSVYKDFPDPQKSASAGFIPIPTYKFITDTVTQGKIAVIHDTPTVYLPREQKYYEEDDGRLRLWVSGFEPRLDRFELDHVEKIVTNTVTVAPPKWCFLMDGGFGTDVFGKTVMLYPFIGARINYQSRFELGAEFGYAAYFNNNAVTTNPIINVKFKYAFLRL